MRMHYAQCTCENTLVFLIRIRLDPYHWAGPGSGSTSGNFDLDPGSKKKSGAGAAKVIIRLSSPTYKTTQNEKCLNRLNF